MQKNSNSDYDGQIVQTISLDIGKKGLDLRTNDDPDALTSLNNARFTDSTSIERRTGFTSQIVQDGAPFNNGQTGVGDWLYGFGNVTTAATKAHHPISSQCLSTFNFEGNDVSWTGDRLLVHLNDGVSKCLGSSDYWRNHTTAIPVANSAELPYGIPCYVPSVTDILPPIKATAAVTEQNTHDICATNTQYCIVYSSQGGTYAQIINRDTGRLISNTKLNGSTTANKDPRVVFSSGVFVAYWWDSTTNILYTASFNGVAWTAEASAITSVAAYSLDSPIVGGGYYLIYRSGTNVKIRYYIGTLVQSSPFASDTTIATGAVSSVAISINSQGKIGIAWGTAGGTFAQEFNNNLAAPTANAGPFDSITGAMTGLSIVSKAISYPTGDVNYPFSIPWVVYSSSASVGTKISVFSPSTGTVSDSLNSIKPNCVPASRAFSIGNETFIWLRNISASSTVNSSVYFLLAGVYKPIVCGYADRGIAETSPPLAPRSVNLGGIAKDPLDPYKVLWVRSIANSATNANHLLYSVINFLPQITYTQYGSSIYISGSAVANFDGTTVADAGFQSYPEVVSGVASAGGSLSAGNYSIRIYCVRYNNKGERFVSPARTSVTVTAAGSQKITWLARSVLTCTATDANLEVYRTQAGGTTYYLESTIANTEAAAGAIVSTLADATLANNPTDPYQSQIGGLSELMENGPIGCTIITTYNDRVWGAGGQVPDGQIQFSKLKTAGLGAGFSALVGLTVIDSEQNNITSIAGINDTLAVFEKEKVFLLDTNGPDNFGRGNFSPVKFATKKGATTHFGTILTDAGLAYWNEGGPYLLTGNSSIVNISDNIRPLAITLTPTGVTLNPQKQEVVWYTDTGIALLWDYKSGNRWAQWSGLYVKAASRTALAMTNGNLFTENSSVYNDGGQVYTFSFKTGQLRAEQLLSGYNLLKKYGVTGEFAGEHILEFRVYYNGSPLWEEDELWAPDTQTYLTIASDYGALTAAQVDAIAPLDKSGNYSFNKRAQRQNCQRFQLELLDNAPDGPSYFPLSLEFELGARPGFGRTASTVVTDK